MIGQANQQASSAVPPKALGVVLEGWADGKHGSLAQRLAQGLRRAVAAGALPDGAQLPAERTLAVALSVSRSTVTAALDELRAEGTLRSRQGSRTVVSAPGGRAIPGTRIAEHLASVPGIDLAAGNPPDASHLPPVSVDVAALLTGDGPGVAPLGLSSLRVALAERLGRDGHHTDPDQIHITSGAHQAIALTVGALTVPRSSVAVEESSYPGIFDIIDALDARALPVRADGAGLLPDDLERVLAEHRPPVLYTQTGPHNPTGRVPTPARLRALARILDRHETTVVEDCTLADLAFAGRPGPELVDQCRRATVVSVGSFSKVAWGGLRIGWLRAPAPLVERTMYLRLANDLGPSVPAQLLVLQLLPHLDDLAERRRRTLEATLGRVMDRLRSDLPEWHFSEPAGGSVLWVHLPVADSGPYVVLARRHGVHIAPGSIATPTRSPNPYIRICVDRPWAVVDEGLRRLQRAWSELARAPRTVLG